MENSRTLEYRRTALTSLAVTSIGICRANRNLVARSRILIANSRRHLNPWWALAGGSGDDDLSMSTRTCFVCDEPLLLGVECEISGPQGSVFAHFACYSVWREETDQQTSEPAEGSVALLDRSTGTYRLARRTSARPEPGAASVWAPARAGWAVGDPDSAARFAGPGSAPCCATWDLLLQLASVVASPTIRQASSSWRGLSQVVCQPWREANEGAQPRAPRQHGRQEAAMSIAPRERAGIANR